MSRKILVCIVILVILIAAWFIFIKNRSFYKEIPGSTTIKGLEIRDYEKNLVWARSDYATLPSTLWFKDFPFLKDHFPSQTFNRIPIKEEPISSWLNSKNNLYLAIKRKRGEVRIPAIIIFNKDGSYFREIALPTELASKAQSAQWVGEKIYLSGWIRDGAERGYYQYILDPRQNKPTFTPLEKEEELLGVWFSTPVSESVFLGTYCSKSALFEFGDNPPPCTEKTLALLNTDVPERKKILAKPVDKGTMCVAFKDQKIYLKTIPGDILNKVLGEFYKTNPDNQRIIDMCQTDHGLDFSSEKNELTIIPFEFVK